MIILIAKTDLLKDNGVGAAKPYSLGRTQLALWTLIIFCCFTYSWGRQDFVADRKVIVGKTALILLGISVGTSIIGKAIDESDRRNLASGLISTRHQNDQSEGFVLDIISDKDGISIVRLQNVVFSALLMTGFVISVVKTGTMPEYDESLLVLSGISGGGYLGVKTNENK